MEALVRIRDERLFSDTVDKPRQLRVPIMGTFQIKRPTTATTTQTLDESDGSGYGVGCPSHPQKYGVAGPAFLQILSGLPTAKACVLALPPQILPSKVTHSPILLMVSIMKTTVSFPTLTHFSRLDAIRQKERIQGAASRSG